jgi:integrase
MARDTKNLTRLPSGVYQVEWSLPSDIRAQTGKRTWRKSTGSRDPKEAARVRDETMVAWRAEVERLRNPSIVERLDARITIPADYPGSKDEFYDDLIAMPGDDGGLPSLVEYIGHYMESVRGQQAAARVVYELAEVPFPAEQWKKYYEQAERVMAFARDGDLLLSKLLSAPTRMQGGGERGESITITDALERWKRNTRPTKTTESAYSVMVRRFVEANGDVLVSDIDRQQVRKFRDKVEEQVKSAGTVAIALSKLTALLNWAGPEGEGYRSGDNPAKGLRPTKNVAEPTKKRPFGTNDINKVHDYIVRTYRPNEDRYWLFTAALLSGLRAEELCALRSCDVRKEFDVWLFDVNREGGKFVKNKSSIRLVPIHRQLVDLGFLEHHRRTSSSGRLFPALLPDNDGRYSGYWLNQFNHVLHKKLGFGADKSFHSTRHAFQDQMRNAGIEITVRDRLFGHTEGFGHNEGRSKRAAVDYGEGHFIKVLNDELQKIAYLGVDWDILVGRSA